MTYRAFWSPEAELQLESILADPASREKLAAIAHDIDRALAIDPVGFGESRSGSIRVGFILPLAVQYDLLDDVATVIVEDVFRTELRRKH
jgi:hypothetical protein